MDEPSPGEEEAVCLKRRRVEVGDEAIANEQPMRGDPEQTTVVPESGVALDAETAPLQI